MSHKEFRQGLSVQLGIDISDLRSKSINEFLPPVGTPPDLIISVCSGAEHDCPIFPGTTERLHWPFDDPAHAEGTEEEKFACFRRVRDEIHNEYGIMRKLITTRNPQANSMVERIHQVVHNMIHTSRINGQDDLDPDFDWRGIRSAV